MLERWRSFAALTWMLAIIIAPAVAQDNYPSSPIRIVVGYPPGATNDLVARLLAQKLATQMNVNVIVDNKPGASGNIGAEFVVKSKPDGYTLLFNTPAVIMSPVFGEKLSYDVFKDLAPVSRVASAPYFLVVTQSIPVNTVAEFIAYMRANPNKLAYGSSGIGSTPHTGSLLFMQTNNLTATHIPYKGAGEAGIDLVAGRIQFRFSDPVSSLPMAKDKRIKVLAFGGLKRSPLMPDVPTLSETGMPGFELGSWFAVMAPVKTPPVIIKRLNSEIVKALQDPDIRARIEQEGAEPRSSTPEEYGAYLRSEMERWTKVIKNAGLTPE